VLGPDTDGLQRRVDDGVRLGQPRVA
jgi:hypothetical protein